MAVLGSVAGLAGAQPAAKSFQRNARRGGRRLAGGQGWAYLRFRRRPRGSDASSPASFLRLTLAGATSPALSRRGRAKTAIAIRVLAGDAARRTDGALGGTPRRRWTFRAKPPGRARGSPRLRRGSDRVRRGEHARRGAEARERRLALANDLVNTARAVPGVGLT